LEGRAYPVIGARIRRLRYFGLSAGLDISAAARPMFSGEHGKPFLQEAAIEIGVVRDDEHYPVEQIVDGAVINAVTGDHLIGDARNLRYLRQD
jgi:hypothetical protein